MSYVRVWVVENSGGWAEQMKIFKKQLEPGLKAQVKAGNLISYNAIQTGPNSGVSIVEFETKAKMNKVIKAMNSARVDIAATGESQSWVYTGQVKASG